MTFFSLHSWNRLLGLFVLGLGLTGCGDLLLLVDNWITPVDLATLPPCVDDDCNCGDFASQTQAQTVLDAFASDPYGLDGDGNGTACELLPPVPPPPDPPAPPASDPHLVLGNPSQAAANPNNYLLQRNQYALSYSRDRNGLNWASWEVDAAWLGSTARQDNFRPDGDLPAGFYQVTPNDYRGSGYDRGHVVPSGDRTSTVSDNAATFLMTNIIPQTPENNRGPWRELEEYGRTLVYQYDRSLHVFAGAYGSQGSVGDRAMVEDRPPRAIVVPSRLWKVIVVYDRLPDGSLGIGSDTQVIVVDMPNTEQLNPNWQQYQTSLQRLEVATGYTFLENLPADLQTALKARTSDVP